MSESLMQVEKLVALPGSWLVIGSGSLVGSKFVELVGVKSTLYGAGQSEIDSNNKLIKGFQGVDVTDYEQVLRVIDQSPVEYVINFAGATAVDQIEKDRPKNPLDPDELEQNFAYRINVMGTKNIIEACKKLGKFPLFISTGFVFDGKSGPYSEEDPVAENPEEVGWYGWTKILAERVVQESGISSLTLRISYPYSDNYPHKLDFARSFLKLYDEVKSGKKEKWYPIFDDQTLTPTLIDDLPYGVATLVKNKATGIYHLTSPEITTPYDFCCELLRVARGVENVQELVPRGKIVEFQRAHPELSKRPIKGGEKSDKITQAGFKPTSWKEGIKIYAR